MHFHHVFTAVIVTFPFLSASASVISARGANYCDAIDFCPRNAPSSVDIYGETPLDASKSDFVQKGVQCQYGDSLSCFYKIQEEEPNVFSLTYIERNSWNLSPYGHPKKYAYEAVKPGEGACPIPDQVSKLCRLPWD